MLSAKLIFGVLIAVSSLGAAQAQEPAARYVRVTDADIKWSPIPSMPKGTQIAILYGNPAAHGLFTLRLKIPAHSKVPVHFNPDERVRTIISGTYYSALGDKVDNSKLMAFPAGTVSSVSAKAWQFAETRDEEVVFQVTGIGPTGITYLNPDEDPRKAN
ncbi:cupin domain-containing protein [Bradyrhizobium diazoefficiens]|uniref:cupin domain-containing protein n=1 Tax=Bradyrhizobium diazoefficiens TaxID=1355477 RepID=UPI00190BD9C7|nr:cupin domain-containing protein [Bradyrhizobium diazoefficiens]MBK3664770.1 cupin domain-containing protein [Bradyrhizobium diazoefficiens]